LLKVLLVRRVLLTLFGAVLALTLLLGGLSLWWLDQPMALASSANSPVLDLEVEFGTPARGVAEAVAASGARVRPGWLYAWFRVSGQARQIKAGSYEIAPGTTPRALLRMLVRGEEALKSVTLPEGLNFAQVLEIGRAPV